MTQQELDQDIVLRAALIEAKYDQILKIVQQHLDLLEPDPPKDEAWMAGTAPLEELWEV